MFTFAVEAKPRQAYFYFLPYSKAGKQKPQYSTIQALVDEARRTASLTMASLLR